MIDPSAPEYGRALLMAQMQIALLRERLGALVSSLAMCEDRSDEVMVASMASALKISYGDGPEGAALVRSLLAVALVDRHRVEWTA